MNYCFQCEHFIGAGDFNLCCTEQYGLCYATTEACDKFVHCSKEDLEFRKQTSWNYQHCYAKKFKEIGVEI